MYSQGAHRITGVSGQRHSAKLRISGMSWGGRLGVCLGELVAPPSSAKIN